MSDAATPAGAATPSSRGPDQEGVPKRRRSGLRVELGRAGLALGGRVAATVASIALTVITARALGPADRGVLVLAILAGFIASIPVRAATPTIAYELGLVQRGHGGTRDALIADSWRTAVLTSAVVGAGLGAVAVVAGWGIEVGLITVASLIAAVLISTPYGAALADGRTGRVGLLTAGYPVAAVAGALAALAIGGADLLHVAVGWSAGAVIGAALGVDRASVRALRGSARAGSMRRQARFSLKAAGTTLVTTTAGRADILLLGLLGTTTSVGLYSVAVGASELVWFAGEALAIAAYGRIGAGNHRDAVRTTWRLCGLTVIVAAIQAAVLWVVAHDAMALVFGEPFRQSGDYLQILLVGSMLGSPLMAISTYLTNQLGRPLLGLVVAAATLASATVTCLIAIPRWDASGAALGSTVGYGVGSLVAVALLIATGRPPRHAARV